MSGRIYRTVDGRHVPDGDPDAAFLAFSQYDELPADVAAELKQAGRSADKQAAKSADKSRSRS
ncbi:MAG: hypothetical protein ACRD0W_18055 [Acidimicrobiales bacterium]